MNNYLLLILSLWLTFSGIEGHAQFFDEVDFVGGMGTDNWSEGWAQYSPNQAKYDYSKKARVTLSGKIAKDLVLNNKTVYTLKGPVFVTNGANLYIEPGTHILGSPAPVGALIITKGSKIIANGTKNEPIVFTSSLPPAKKKPGDWGGIVLLGKAQVNIAGGEGQMEGPGNLPKYGGKDDFDNSGILKYVRIEFAGRKFGEDKEMNGISLFGVGQGTTLENVMVSYSKDDSFEFYGGTVNAKYLISNRCADDDFDLTLGYRGNIQFALALRHHLISDPSGSRAVEADTYETLADRMMDVPTTAKLSNFTVVSPEMIIGKEPSKMIKEVVYMYNGAGISVENSLFVGFPVGFKAKGPETGDFLKNGKAHFHHNALVGIKKPVSGLELNFDVNTWFVEPKRGNKIINSSRIPNIFKNKFSVMTPDFEVSPNMGVKPSFKDLPTESKTSHEFYTEANYVGAVAKGDEWVKGWTNFAPNNEDYGKPSVTFEGKITENTTIDSGAVCLLKGNVVVDNGVTLTINPGAIVMGESASKATLIISPNGKIEANGTKELPVVFTSDQAKGKRSPGDWGGIVVIGKSKVHTGEPVMSSKDIQSWLPEISLAGLQGSESQGNINYTRIEFAGGKVKDGDKMEELSGLILIGVNEINIDYVMVTQSGNDGFELVGGSPDMKHIISHRTFDDDFSIEYGYAGKIQFGIVSRDPNLAATDGAYAIHISKYQHYVSLNELPEFSNMTILGPRSIAGDGYINQNYKAGVSAHDKAAFKFHNSIVSGYDLSINVSGMASTFYMKSGISSFMNNFIATSATEKAFLSDFKPDKILATSVLRSSLNNNNTVSSHSQLKLDDTTKSPDRPTFAPEPTSPVIEHTFMPPSE